MPGFLTSIHVFFAASKDVDGRKMSGNGDANGY
jgi:hypothetical protein